VPIIDGYTILGCWPFAEVELSVASLAEGMQARQVARALITHTTAIFYDAALGNDQAFELAAQHPPLTPVPVINPLRYPECLAEIDRCLAKGARAFRLCPREHHYPFTGALGPLRETLRLYAGSTGVTLECLDQFKLRAF